jgi:hypothetical protein
VTETTTTGLGPLAAALAKASTAFPAVTRSKTVTVRMKDGGTYSFKYAPLDVILGAVQQPLADNGLVVVQLLDDGALITSLIHESGAILSGRIDLPQSGDVQALGSAITYLRRYAIQAMLGIAAEDDDDGNRAAGNKATIAPDVQHGDDGSLIGIVQVGDRSTSDYLLRQTPEGSALGFRLRGEKGGILVETLGPLADQLMVHKAEAVGARVTVWGTIGERTFTPKTGRSVTYQVLAAERVRLPGIGDLPSDAMPEPSTVGVEAESEPLFSDQEQAAIDADLERILS